MLFKYYINIRLIIKLLKYLKICSFLCEKLELYLQDQYKASVGGNFDKMQDAKWSLKTRLADSMVNVQLEVQAKYGFLDIVLLAI